MNAGDHPDGFGHHEHAGGIADHHHDDHDDDHRWSPELDDCDSRSQSQDDEADPWPSQDQSQVIGETHTSLGDDDGPTLEHEHLSAGHRTGPDESEPDDDPEADHDVLGIDWDDPVPDPNAPAQGAKDGAAGDVDAVTSALLDALGTPEPTEERYAALSPGDDVAWVAGGWSGAGVGSEPASTVWAVEVVDPIEGVIDADLLQ